MAQEVERIRRKKSCSARKQEERKNLVPTQKLQPKERALRYTNVRSARAEEGVLRIILLQDEFFRALDTLTPEHFSSPLLGRAYGELRRRWQEGRPVTLSGLDGVFTPEELDHLSAIAQEPQPMHTAAAALADFQQTILAEFRRGEIRSGEDLAGLRDTLKQKKSYGG
jgi:DNA primase